MKTLGGMRETKNESKELSPISETFNKILFEMKSVTGRRRRRRKVSQVSEIPKRLLVRSESETTQIHLLFKKNNIENEKGLKKVMRLK